MFIHLGMAEEICRRFNIDWILLRCVKCLTFWMVLIYVCLVTFDFIVSVAVSFGAAYASLFLDLLLDKLAKWYNDKWES